MSIHSNKTFKLDDWKRGDPLTAGHFQQSHDALKTLTGGVALPRQLPLPPNPKKGEAGAAGSAGQSGKAHWEDFVSVITVGSVAEGSMASVMVRFADVVFHQIAASRFVAQFRLRPSSAGDGVPRSRLGNIWMAKTEFDAYAIGSEVPLHGPEIFLTEGQARKICVVVNAGKFVLDIPGQPVTTSTYTFVDPVRNPTLTGQ